MIDEIKKLRQITETLTGNGYLRDQAEEWEYALDAIPDPIYIVDSKFRIKFVNKAFSHQIGISKKGCFNQDCDSFIGTCREGECPEYWRTVDEVKETPFIKDVYLSKFSRWYNINRSPIYTKSNKFIGFICVLQDVTVERDALKKLKWRESTLKTIFNASPIGMGLLNHKTRVIKAVNKNVIDMLGYSEKDVVGKNARFIYPSEEEYERVGKQIVNNIEKVDYNDIETTWVTKDGKYLHIYLKLSYVESNGDTVFTAVDITRIKQTEQSMQLFVNQTPLAVVGWDLDCKVFTWNPAAVTIFGYTEEEAFGQHCNFILPEGNNEEIDQVWEDLITQTGGNKNRNVNVTKDGKSIICEWYNNPLIDASGKTVGVMSLALDVTNFSEEVQKTTLETEKFKAIFESNRDVMVVARMEDGIITDINHAYETYTGYTKSEVVGKKIPEFSLWASPREREEFYDILLEKGTIDEFKAFFITKSDGVKEYAANASIIEIDGQKHSIFSARVD